MIPKKAIKFFTKKDNKPEKTEKAPKKTEVKKVKEPYSPKYLVKAEGEDAAKYDFVAERPPRCRAKLPEATIHLASNSFGVTIISLCELYARNGLMGSAIANVIMGVIMSYSLYSLTRSAQKVYGMTNVPQMTYPDLAQAAMDISIYPKLRKYGGKFKAFVVAVIVANLIGKCCINQIITARIIQTIVGSKETVGMTRRYLASLMVLFFLICMPRTIVNIAPFMIVTQLYSVLTCAFLLSAGLWIITGNPIFNFLYILFKDTTSFFSLWAGCAFAMDTTRAVLTVENSMDAPKQIYKVIITGTFITTVLATMLNLTGSYIGTAIKMIEAVVILCLNPMFWLMGLFLFTVCFSAYITYALDFYILFNLIWVYLKKKHAKEKHWIIERIYRACFVLGITILVLVQPGISFYMSFFGSLSSIVSNFIIVPIIEFLVDTRHKGPGRYKWKIIRLVAITFPALIFIICGIISSIYDVLDIVYKIEGYSKA